MDILTHLLSGAVAGLLYNPGSTPVRHDAGESFPPSLGDRGLPSSPVAPSEGLLVSPVADAAVTRKAVRLALLIGSVLPDIDIVFLLGGWSLYRTYHRGPTHSVLGVLLLAFLLSWIIGKRYKEVDKGKLFLASLMGMGMHVGLDLLTSYRTYLLWPFSDQRFAYGILRFHDRTGWWMLGSALLVGWVAERSGKGSPRLPLPKGSILSGVLGLLLYGGYILLQAGPRIMLLRAG